MRASTAYLEVTGSAGVADSDGSAGGGDVIRMGTVRGLGDTTVALGHTMRRIGGSSYYFETTARVRLPTGDESKGLGVGVVDYGLSGEIGLNESGGGASLEITRRFLGDRAGLNCVDGWQTNAAAWWRPTASTQIGLAGFWREASVASGDDPAQVGAFASYQWTPNVRLSLSASAGLSDATADYSTDMRVTWTPFAH